MPANAARYNEEKYEMIDGIKVRLVEIEGPYAHMLPDRTPKENKDNKKNILMNIIKAIF